MPIIDMFCPKAYYGSDWGPFFAGGTAYANIYGGGRRANEYYLYMESHTDRYVWKKFDTQYNIMTIGFAMYMMPFDSGWSTYDVTRMSHIVEFRAEGETQAAVNYSIGDNATRLYLQMRDHLNTTLSTATYGLEIKSWYYIEVRVQFEDNGIYEIRINGATVLSGTGDFKKTTANWANGTVIRGAQAFMKMDFYWTGGASTQDAPFLGDVRLDCVVPTADGTYTNFIPSTGVSGYLCIDEIPVTTTDYVSCGTLDGIGTYKFAQQTLNTPIYATRYGYIAQRSDAAVRSIQPMLRSNNIDISVGDSHELLLGSTPRYSSLILEKDPTDDAQWTDAKINSAEFGWKVTV